jgi:Rps23 Pro-64 3,4-dihydroxylase Tpa1-like proline 4-hydroxylase
VLLDPRRWDLERLRADWLSATPFPHAVIDGFVEPDCLSVLVAAFDDEPADNIQDEIFDVMASAPQPTHEAFRALSTALSSQPVLEAAGAIAGQALRGVEMRAYAYLPGHYLLPHADRDLAGRRVLAYAFYVGLLDGLQGGELDLYRCEVRDGAIVRTEVETTIMPHANRCVLFEVSPQSLHRVREVTAGGRLSLAGWFTR